MRPSSLAHDPAAVDAAIESPRTLRAFLPTPGPREVVEDLLRVAARAPSGTHIAPCVMAAARGRGPRTGPQAAFMPLHRISATHAGAPDDERLACGPLPGPADAAAVEHSLVTERVPVAGFVRFLD